jgi:hypothetical protein
MLIAAAPAAPPLRAEAPVVQPQARPAVAKTEPAAPPPAAVAAAEPVAPPSPPVFATLAIAPPNFNNLTSSPPAAFADPASAPVAAAAPIQEVDTTATIETSEPISGPVPLPRHKPHVSAALTASTVPLPRPRPTTEETTAPDLPAFDRHTAD